VKQADVETMLSAIERDARETGSLTGRPVFSDRVLAAMRAVPREAFVSEQQAPHAYENTPLPIGHNQTISQPYIVALMTELLDLSDQARVLEVGTGCGYQAAVLAESGATVFSIEVVEPLAIEAADRLKHLGYDRVTVRAGDGYAGWPEHAPFDGIIVTAAAPAIPPPLIEQLKPGGVLVIPVGPITAAQSLIRIGKRADGTIEKTTVIPVAFVPLTGDHGRGPAG
jgi:protein-L-isoaspartate(D-aspartate) O-methyltransferase